ncbi:MAG: hypothetical protein RL226_2314 [Bacteroidota bacterium]
MKKLTSIFAVLFLLAGTVATQAQDSAKILNELSAKAKKFTNVYAEYSSRLIDKKNAVDLKQEGKVYVEGEKYHLEMGEYVLITDGQTHWTYEKETNDCYIDYLEDMKDGAMSPSDMFTIWEKDFKHELKETVKENGKDYYLIYLYPLKPADKPYHTIQLYVDKAKMEVAKIIVKGREGNDVIYTLKTFKPNSTMPANIFKFVPSSRPGVQMIDNRI